MLKLRHTGTVTITTGTIAASGTYTTDAFDCTDLEGGFSLQWTLTGTGTMKAEVLSSNDGVTFLDVNTDITTAQTATTGPASDGKNLTDFSVLPCNQLKIKFTETGGANAVAVAARLRAF